MTYAEQTWKRGQRDDEHMIYEMYMFSQYSDGSVLDCYQGITYTAKEVATGTDVVQKPPKADAAIRKLTRAINGDLRRNAKAAVKNGTTKNLAPFVQWRQIRTRTRNPR